jgi:hypothetical protein
LPGTLYILSVSDREVELDEHAKDECVDYFGDDFQDSPDVINTIGKSCSKDLAYSMTEVHEHPFGDIACLVMGEGWEVDYDFTTGTIGDRDDYA